MPRPKKRSNDAVAVSFRKDNLIVEFKDGRVLSTPLAFHKPLLAAKPAQRRDFLIINKGGGIRWPALDYDLSVTRLLVPDGAGLAPPPYFPVATMNLPKVSH